MIEKKNKNRLTGADRTPAQKAADEKRRSHTGANRTPAQKAASETLRSQTGANRTPAQKARDRKGADRTPAQKAATKRSRVKADAAFRAAVLDDGYVLLSAPNGSQDKVQMWCGTVGCPVYGVRPASFMKGQRCPSCAAKRRSGLIDWTNLGGNFSDCFDGYDAYLISFTDESQEPFWKVGLSGATSSRLDRHLSSGAKLATKFRTYKLMAFMLEQHTLDVFDDFRKSPNMPKGWGGGNETLRYDARPLQHVLRVAPQLAPAVDDGRLVDPDWDTDWFWSAWERAAESRMASWEAAFFEARFKLDKCFDDLTAVPSFVLRSKRYSLGADTWRMFLRYWSIAEGYGASIEDRRMFLWAALHDQNISSVFSSDQLYMQKYVDDELFISSNAA